MVAAAERVWVPAWEAAVPVPTEAPPSSAQVRALEQQVRALEQQVRALERQVRGVERPERDVPFPPPAPGAPLRTLPQQPDEQRMASHPRQHDPRRRYVAVR